MSSPSKTRLLYVTDPMCSWCWGFNPTLAHLEEVVAGVPVQMVLGGLAPDSSEPMPDETRAYVQAAWRAVSARTGASFNFEFWERCAPRRSTWPACRAVLLGRAAGKEREVFHAIQAAYYERALNPSEPEVLADLAAEVGLDRATFLAELDGASTRAALDADRALAAELGARSFPSLGVEHEGRLELLFSGWCGADEAEMIWRRWAQRVGLGA
jgi:putative protein-disulfide isomerase